MLILFVLYFEICHSFGSGFHSFAGANLSVKTYCVTDRSLGETVALLSLLPFSVSAPTCTTYVIKHTWSLSPSPEIPNLLHREIICFICFWYICSTQHITTVKFIQSVKSHTAHTLWAAGLKTSQTTQSSRRKHLSTMITMKRGERKVTAPWGPCQSFPSRYLQLEFTRRSPYLTSELWSRITALPGSGLNSAGNFAFVSGNPNTL